MLSLHSLYILEKMENSSGKRTTSKENFLQSFCAGKWGNKVSMMKDSNRFSSFHRIYD